MKNIADLPQEFQNIFAQLKAEQEVDGTVLAATEDDIRDEAELLGTDFDADPVDAVSYTHLTLPTICSV